MSTGRDNNMADAWCGLHLHSRHYIRDPVGDSAASHANELSNSNEFKASSNAPKKENGRRLDEE